MSKAVSVKGIECPLIREGDDIVKIVVDAIKNEWINDRDVVGITESVVARSLGNYVTIDDIVKEIKHKVVNKKIALWSPIMSRNRFSLILRAFARYADNLIIFINDDRDEQGNPTQGINPFTGVDIQQYYKEICEEEHCEIQFKSTTIFNKGFDPLEYGYTLVDARCHPSGNFGDFDLSDFCNDPSKKAYSEYGLLGSNKAGNERLKLYPTRISSQQVCDAVKTQINKLLHKDIIVCVYGDGCFKDPVGGIWEFADPTTMPGYTDVQLIESSPNELKLKYLIDTVGVEGIEQIQKPEKLGQMGTTPRLYRDLLASLMDLTSGSGDRATPVVLIQNYF